MKKTQKKLLGSFGFLVVVAMTVFAACLPSPETSAVEPVTTLTDVISVRVVGTDPRVEVTGLSDSVVTSYNQSFGAIYENVGAVSATIQYTDDTGKEYEAEDLFKDLDVTYYPGSLTVDNINLKTGEYTLSFERYNPDGSTEVVSGVTGHFEHYGYGTYTISMTGASIDGTESEPSTGTLTYVPFYSSVHSAENPDGTTTNYVDVHYTSTAQGDGDVSSIRVVVKDASGKEVFTVGPVAASADGYSAIVLPFADYDLPDGKYEIVVYAYGVDGNQLSNPSSLEIEYEEDIIYVPDTGNTAGLFSGLNISRSDYIITGILTFGIIAIAGAAFLIRTNRQKAMATSRGARVSSRTSRSLKKGNTIRNKKGALHTKKTTKRR